MTEYRFARPDEENDVLDFINAVFSQAARPHDFARLIPKVYAHEGFYVHHALALEGSRIVAAVGMLPVKVRLGADHPPLQAGYIGSVSVHPRFRGQGHMQALMRMQIQEARRRGYDFLALGGQRQRYQYYGFEQGGMTGAFSVNRANARHALPEGKQFRFEEVAGKDHPALGLMKNWQERQNLSCLRDGERFLDTLRTYGGVPYAVFDGERQEWAGYIAALDKQITELVLKREADLAAVLGAWVREKGNAVLLVPGGLWGRWQAVQAFSESCEISDGEMVKILNWEKVLSAALCFQAESKALPDGEWTLAVQDAGEWTLRVRAGKAQVDPAEGKADACLEEKQAVRLLFSPLGALLPGNKPPCAWLPLPLEIPIADQF